MKNATKILALMLALAMVFALCACGSTSTAPSAPAAPADNAPAAPADKPADAAPAAPEANAEPVKIGVIFYGTDDDLGKSVYYYVTHAAELMGNVELTWALGDFDSASQLQAAENLISAGVDGLMWLPLDDSANLMIGNLCQENGVYFSIMYRSINDQAIAAAVDANPFFVSDCFEDEYGAAGKMAEVVAGLGSKVVGSFADDASSGMQHNRYMGMADAVESLGMSICGEFPTSSSGDATYTANGITNLVNLYPDMDAFFMLSGSLGMSAVIADTFDTLVDPGTVRIFGFDTYEGMAEDFESGTLGAIAGGMAPDSLFTFLMLYNQCDGTPLSEGKGVYLPAAQIILTSADDCELFNKYVDRPDYCVFTDEQIMSLAGRHNPNATLEDLMNLQNAFSPEFVKENIH